MNQMKKFELSIPAQNTVHEFYNKKGIVYVEGKDDLMFWRTYFPETDYVIREVEGCRNLSDMIDQIINHGLRNIVACDLDYNCYTKRVRQHPLIIRTLSHSIECMMYCPENVNDLIKLYTRSFDNHVTELNNYYKRFGDDVKLLVAYDVANNVFEKGVSVLGKSCIRVLSTDEPHLVDKDKVSDIINRIKPSFSEQEINESLELIDNDSRTMREIMKGHFQTDFVRNLIKFILLDKYNKNMVISNDDFYAHLVICTSQCPNKCTEKKYLEDCVMKAQAYLENKRNWTMD
jgi:hypothetical protein